MNTTPTKRVLIVGGGFGGVRLAQILGKRRGMQVKLVDPKSYMEYHAAAYRLVTGRSPAEVCLPYADLLKGTNVELVRDTIETMDVQKKEATGTSGASYPYDVIVMAVGSESSFFGIKGVEEHAFGMNSVDDALKLRRHIHELFETAKTTNDEKTPLLHVVVIGGGASGVELSGEFASYMKTLAVRHGVDPSLVSVDLIEAMPRLMPGLPEDMSGRILRRLQELGVNVYLNRSVIEEDVDKLFLKDMQMTVKTVVWTAGLKANAIASKIPGLLLDKRGRIQVDPYMRVPGADGMFAIGDIAVTKYSGMAQTALHDAEYVARVIAGSAKPYVPQPPAYAVPAGRNWAAVLYCGMRFYGFPGWMLRRAADFRAFLSLLPFPAAVRAFFAGWATVESCPVCRSKSR